MPPAFASAEQNNLLRICLESKFSATPNVSHSIKKQSIFRKYKVIQGKSLQHEVAKTRVQTTKKSETRVWTFFLGDDNWRKAETWIFCFFPGRWRWTLLPKKRYTTFQLRGRHFTTELMPTTDIWKKFYEQCIFGYDWRAKVSETETHTIAAPYIVLLKTKAW